MTQSVVLIHHGEESTPIVVTTAADAHAHILADVREWDIEGEITLTDEVCDDCTIVRVSIDGNECDNDAYSFTPITNQPYIDLLDYQFSKDALEESFEVAMTDEQWMGAAESLAFNVELSPFNEGQFNDSYRDMMSDIWDDLGVTYPEY